MKKRAAFFANHQFLVDNNGTLIGVEMNGDTRIMVGDRVRIEGDYYGYITPGISRPGLGVVTEIADDYSDHYFGVTMDSNSEFGFVKESRITEVIPPPFFRRIFARFVKEGRIAK